MNSILSHRLITSSLPFSGLAKSLRLGACAAAMALCALPAKAQDKGKGGDAGSTFAASDMDIDTYVEGAALVTLYHELGHALVDIFGLPVLGREEDAADAFALVELVTLIRAARRDEALEAKLISYGHASADQWLKSSAERGSLDSYDFYGEHALDRQRLFNTVCLLVGGRSSAYDGLPESLGIDSFHTGGCELQYDAAYDGWTYTLDSFGAFDRDPEPGEEDLAFIFEEPEREQHQRWATHFENWAQLPAIQEHFSNSYDLDRPIVVRFTSCGEENAYYIPAEKEVQMCYELLNAYARQGRQSTEAVLNRVE